MRGVEQGDDEGDDGCALDRWVVVGFYEVEEELFGGAKGRVVSIGILSGRWWEKGAVRAQVCTYIHENRPRKQMLAGWMQQQNPLEQIEGVKYEKVVLALGAAHREPVERHDELLRHVPLEPFLQLEELAKGRVRAEIAQCLWGG